MTAVSGTAVKGAGAPWNTAAAQVKAQRRRYASAVLRSLSRTYAGRPAHEVQRARKLDAPARCASERWDTAPTRHGDRHRSAC